MKRSRDESDGDMEWRPSENENSSQEESEEEELEDELGKELIRLIGLSRKDGLRMSDIIVGEITPASLEAIEKGFRENKSIRELVIENCDFSSGSLLKAMLPFAKCPADRGAPKNSELFNEIHLRDCTISVKAMKIFSRALSKQTALDSIAFGYGNDITPRGWEFFYASLKCPQMALRELLIHDPMNDQGMVLFSAGLSKNKSLRELIFSTDTESTSDVGWAAFGYALSKCNIEHLYLLDNELNGETMAALAIGLANCKKLKMFSLQNEQLISGRGIREISGLLTNPQSKIEFLAFDQCALTDNDVAILSDSLKKNCFLTHLVLYNDSKLKLSQLHHLLCNESSIEQTYHSNHTLTSINPGTVPLPQDLERLLELNGNSNKKLVAVKKVFDCHLNGCFNLQPFQEMKVKLWANVLGWVATPLENDYVDVSTRLSAVFRLLKSKPALFGF